MLAAIVAGNEIVTRVGMAASGAFHKRGFHPTAVCGIFGGTAAAMRLAGCNARKTASALGIAGSFAGGLFAYLEDGTATKPMHAAWAAHGSVLAARLAALGAEGPPSVLEGRFGLYHAFLGAEKGEVDIESQLADLGERWETPRIAYKPYPACHFMHGSLGSTASLLGDVSPDEIDEVVVTIPEAGVSLVLEPANAKIAPRTEYEGKFSLQYSTAAMLVHGRVGVQTYSEEALADPATLELAKRVRYETKDYPTYPAAFPGGVRIRTRDGRTLEADFPYQQGGPENPMSADEVRAKFRENALLALSADAAEALEVAVLSLDEQESVRSVFPLLAESECPHDSRSLGSFPWRNRRAPLPNAPPARRTCRRARPSRWNLPVPRALPLIGQRTAMSRRADGDRHRDPRVGRRGGDPVCLGARACGCLPRDARRADEGLGLFGVIIPEEYGGLGLDLTTYVLIQIELSRGWMSLSGVLNTHFLSAWMIQQYGTDDQRQRYLPRMAKGEVRSAYSMTEPHAGSDVQAIRTSAVRDGDDYVITGQKMWATNGLRAGLVMLLAKTDPDADPPHRGMTAFLLEKEPGVTEQPGLTIPPPLKKLGYKGVESTELVFDGFRTPASSVLGGEAGVGRGFQVLHGRDRARPRQHRGARRRHRTRAFEEAIGYAQEREAFGKPIAEHQAIQLKLAQMATKIEAARLLTIQAAERKDAGDRADLEAGMAKLFATETAAEVALEAMRIHGGYGYSQEFVVERLYRDAPVLILGEGSNEIQQLVIARRLLELHARG